MTDDLVDVKISFTLPKWAIGRHVFIFAGTELLAKKECRIIHKNGKHVPVYSSLKIKPDNGRCTGCGICCSTDSLPKNYLNKMKIALNKEPEKGCPFLGDNGCILDAFKPFACVKTICSDYEGCTERVE